MLVFSRTVFVVSAGSSKYGMKFATPFTLKKLEVMVMLSYVCSTFRHIPRVALEKDKNANTGKYPFKNEDYSEFSIFEKCQEKL